jgi:hypothetical protein
MGIIQNPTFVTESEAVISLRPVAYALYQRWQQEYVRRCPMPKPPKRPVTYVDKVYMEDDLNSQPYLIDLNMWNLELGRAKTDFILSRGVLGSPPDDWLPDPDMIPANETERKVLWVMEKLQTEQDLEGCIEAITSLTGITEKAVAEAEGESE